MEIIEDIEVPVVDFSSYGLDKPAATSDEQLSGIVKDIGEALKQCNAFWIKDCGISQELMTDIEEKTQAFYSKPRIVKENYYLKDGHSFPLGYYDEVDNKHVENVAKGHGREAFQYYPAPGIPREQWPGDDVVKGFMTTVEEYYEKGGQIVGRLLECISLHLGLDRGYLVDNYYIKQLNKVEGERQSTMRLNSYPPIKTMPEKGSLRFAAHSDYDLLTLLHLTTEGLLSELPYGRWIPVNPKPGCLLVQAGLVLSSITRGRVPQNRHCVIAPWTEESLAKHRQSIVFFGLPDYHTSLAPIPGLTPEQGKEEEPLEDPRPFGEIVAHLMKAYLLGTPDHKESLRE